MKEKRRKKIIWMCIFLLLSIFIEVGVIVRVFDNTNDLAEVVVVQNGVEKTLTFPTKIEMEEYIANLSDDIEVISSNLRTSITPTSEIPVVIVRTFLFLNIPTLIILYFYIRQRIVERTNDRMVSIG